MFGYYWEYYKNIIIISTIMIVLIISGLYLFYYNSFHENFDINDLGDNKVSINYNKINNEINLKIKNNGEEKIGKYKYQVKIFLSDFDLNCNGNNKICKKIFTNRDLLNNFILGKYSGNLTSIGNFKLKVDDFFNFKFNEKIFRNSIIDIIYNFQDNLIKENKITNSGYEKYFEFKRKNVGDKIYLNNLEIQCISEIKMSIIPGTFEEDRIISEKVKENCKNLGGNQILIINDNNLKEQKIIFTIFIKKVKIVYSFFEKIEGNYKNIKNNEIIIEYNKKIKIN